MRHHHEQDKKATLIAVLPADRFGALSVLNNDIIDFVEKPQGDNNWINRDFFILNPSVIDYIRSDETIWEQEPLNNLQDHPNLVRFIIQVSGNPWILCVTRLILRNYGEQAKHFGKSGRLTLRQ